MKFDEVKDLLSRSLEITNIVDSWYEGIPFLFQRGEELYDAFIYTSERRDSNEFLRPQKVVLVASKTGEVSAIESKELIEQFNCGTNFAYIPKNIEDIFEYLELKKKVENSYIRLREAYLKKSKDVEELKKEYKKEVSDLIPFEIIEKVYKKISPLIFE